MKTDLKWHIRVNVKAAIARAYVRVVGTNREFSWIFFDTLLPLLGTAAYVYIYRAMDAPEEYVGFVLLGGAMTAYWMNVLWNMASNFYFERQGWNLELYFIAPISRMAILAGMAIGGMFMTTIRAGSLIVLGSLLFNVSFSVSSVPLVVLTFVLTLVALYGLGMLFSSLFLMYGREAWHTSNLLQEPVYLLTGFYFPVRALGFYIAIAASIIPLTLGMDAVRQLVFSHLHFGLLPVHVEIAGLGVLGVGLLYAAGVALERMERAAKKEGRLTLRWQ
ncbi:MAG: ABC transporter permease [Bacillota bacterium]